MKLNLDFCLRIIQFKFLHCLKFFYVKTERLLSEITRRTRY